MHLPCRRDFRLDLRGQVHHLGEIQPLSPSIASGPTNLCFDREVQEQDNLKCQKPVANVHKQAYGHLFVSDNCSKLTFVAVRYTAAIFRNRQI